MVNQSGRGHALKAAAQQYRQAQPAPKTPLKEALAEFARSWSHFTKDRIRKLGRAERRAYFALKTEAQREAFLIMRNWWRKERKPELYVHCATLAARLELTMEGASRIRRRFCELGIMRMTARYVRHKRSARYQWLL